MTALTSDAQRVEKEGRLQSFQVAANAVIYKNALVKVNASGYLAPCAAEAGALFVGMAYEAVDATGLSNGDVSIRVELKNAIEIAGSGFVQGDIMKAVYASDDNTVSTVQGANEQLVGRIIEVISATKVLVQPNHAQAL